MERPPSTSEWSAWVRILTQVVGILSNMVPMRRRTNLDTERERINIDDADMFMAEVGQRCPLLDAIELRHRG